ncbi:MAG: LPS assembly lipoprotein LptE [Methylocella sp.]
MSSHELPRRMGAPRGFASRTFASRTLALVLSALMSLALAGCLQPLYGTLASGGDVASQLQAIKIAPIGDRLGHYLENELIFGFNGTGAPVDPRFLLKVSLTESVQTPLMDTVTGYPTSGTVVVTATYALTPSQGGDPITKGVATVVASYDRNSQRFANIRASRDAEIRDARLLAEQIRTNIAAAFAEKG